MDVSEGGEYWVVVDMDDRSAESAWCCVLLVCTMRGIVWINIDNKLADGIVASETLLALVLILIVRSQLYSLSFIAIYLTRLYSLPSRLFTVTLTRAIRNTIMQAQPDVWR